MSAPGPARSPTTNSAAASAWPAATGSRLRRNSGTGSTDIARGPGAPHGRSLPPRPDTPGEAAETTPSHERRIRAGTSQARGGHDGIVIPNYPPSGGLRGGWPDADTPCNRREAEGTMFGNLVRRGRRALWGSLSLIIVIAIGGTLFAAAASRAKLTQQAETDAKLAAQTQLAPLLQPRDLMGPIAGERAKTLQAAIETEIVDPGPVASVRLYSELGRVLC